VKIALFSLSCSVTCVLRRGLRSENPSKTWFCQIGSKEKENNLVDELKVPKDTFWCHFQLFLLFKSQRAVNFLSKLGHFNLKYLICNYKKKVTESCCYCVSKIILILKRFSFSQFSPLKWIENSFLNDFFSFVRMNDGYGKLHDCCIGGT